MKRLLMSTFVIALFLFVSNVSAKSSGNWQYQTNPEEYDTMSLVTYTTELAQIIEEEKNTAQEIAQEQSKIDSLKQLLAQTNAKIDATIKEKYTVLGITEQDVLNAESEIREIKGNLELLLGLTPEELMRRKNEIDDNEARIAALKEKPVSYLWRVRDQIRELDNLLARVKANLPDQTLEYTVELNRSKRDCLYRIAGKDAVYDDASRWPELYRANKDQIDRGYNRYKRNSEDPKYDRPQDLIFPGQVFDIPR